MNRILSIFLAGVVVAQAGLRGDHKVAKHAKHTKLNLLQRQDPSDDEAPYGSFMNTEESDSGDMPDATVESHFDQFACTDHLFSILPHPHVIRILKV